MGSSTSKASMSPMKCLCSVYGEEVSFLALSSIITMVIGLIKAVDSHYILDENDGPQKCNLVVGEI